MKIILSIDGGGIRGIIPATILNYLEQKIQEITGDEKARISNLVDFVAGTSTGSLIGSLMLLPDTSYQHYSYPKYKMSEIVQMYFELGDEVFKKTFFNNIKTLWGLIGPLFPSSNIETPILKFTDHHKLGDLIKPCMFSAYDIKKRRVNFFTNSDENLKYTKYFIKDIIRGSTSIPSYFQPKYFKEGLDENTLIDGGVFANNPAFAAYIEVSKTLFNDKITQFNPNELIVISLGTGKTTKKSFDYKKTKGWGKIKWLLPLIDILTSAQSDIVDYEMQKLFESYDAKHNYKRINPIIKNGSNNVLDSRKENVYNLIKDTQLYIEENKDMLNTLAREICDLNIIFKYDAKFKENCKCNICEGCNKPENNF